MATGSPAAAPDRPPLAFLLFGSAPTVPRARRIIDGPTLVVALSLLALLAWGWRAMGWLGRKRYL